MDIIIKQNDSPNADSQPNKRRRKKSMVWDHFTTETLNGDCVRALCNQCKKSFAYISGSKLAGTSHLKRHIALGICPVARNNQDKDQTMPSPSTSRSNISVNGTHRPRKRYQISSEVANVRFNEDSCSHEFVKMTIQHEYPLNMCEHSGFNNFVRTLQPEFNSISASVIQEQIHSTYLKEKKKVLNLLNGISGHINLTIDFWNSNQSLVYILITGHFIDNDWKLQRRILNFIWIPFPDSDNAFSNAVASSLVDWNLEGKLLSITLDNSYANKNARENLRDRLSTSSLILNGLLIVSSCYACILTSIAKDALASLTETIQKVRDSVKFVKTSDVREEIFNRLKRQLQVTNNKVLSIDDVTKWNSTYHMLTVASELELVFTCLDTADPDYKLTPTVEEWSQVKTLCRYLEIFYKATSILTSPVYPTSNIFFDEVCKVQLELMKDAVNPDSFVSYLTKSLLDKFCKYWEDCYLVLAIAVVMDPRFKMQLVKFNFSRIYGVDAESWIKPVDEGLHELYMEYVVQCLPAPTFIEEGGNDTLLRIDDPQDDHSLVSNGETFPDFDVYISDIMGGQQMKSELDQYLDEALLPRVQGFDVLGWWKLNTARYPTLSKMASDVLSIPFSTIPPVSVFDTTERRILGHQSSLRPSALQALVCAKDWLQHDSSESPCSTPGGNFASDIVKREL